MVHKQMMHNLIQMELYIREYCGNTKLSWCDHEIVDFQSSISNFQHYSYKSEPEIELFDQINMMSEFAKKKAKYFTHLWISFDFTSFYWGIFTGFWFVIF